MLRLCIGEWLHSWEERVYKEIHFLPGRVEKRVSVGLEAGRCSCGSSRWRRVGVRVERITTCDQVRRTERKEPPYSIGTFTNKLLKCFGRGTFWTHSDIELTNDGKVALIKTYKIIIRVYASRI
jgi:hypothetical protein